MISPLQVFMLKERQHLNLQFYHNEYIRKIRMNKTSVTLNIHITHYYIY